MEPGYSNMMMRLHRYGTGIGLLFERRCTSCVFWVAFGCGGTSQLINQRQPSRIESRCNSSIRQVLKTDWLQKSERTDSGG